MRKIKNKLCITPRKYEINLVLTENILGLTIENMQMLQLPSSDYNAIILYMNVLCVLKI